MNTVDQGTSSESPWIPIAREIGKELKRDNPLKNLEWISEKILVKMTSLDEKGQSGLTGRGGKIPSASTILRRALQKLNS
jgi:hypothetical protein